MAKALECPACGAKHRLDGREPSTTFRCDRCGQTLKVPTSLVVAQAAPVGAGVAPPPRRRAPGAAPPREVVGVSATLPASDTGNGGRSADGAPPARGEARARGRVHWYWRLVAWVVAVPLGFVIAAWPAYEFGLIRKDDVLDVFVGSGAGRYTRLAVVTLLWALVTAALVQLFVEGGRWWANRRSRRRASARRRPASAAR